ncbi:DUF4244 domain-containing protein [Pseudonocardia charpentierae]|uniref:DUF4244 domain-containing protein n=1 Tax=Pseudonocardia charpentierae TaxID=3075545 RepID=A0ABU2NAW0_9PSEU|nr:DUF4244 domain-containing protein [Pseudonocardia sp. DSM 45834]MDT0350697.1 DUF4244 domain-containing protein [Pseudonocardia sp. DSM 45834]
MSRSTLPRSRTRRALAGRSDPTPVGLPAARSGIRRRFCRLLRDDAGMSTVEYAIGCVAAAGFAALLYSVVTGDSVTAALTQLVQRALTTGF